MSKLGLGGKKEDKKENVDSLDIPLAFTLATGAVLGLVIVGIIAAGAVYSMTRSKAIELPSATGASASAFTTTTSTTTTTTSSTTTYTTTLKKTTTTSSTTSTTDTSISTTTTISRYMIAACMADRVDEIYLSNNYPSKDLELYLGDYDTLFPISECREKEDRQICNSDLQRYFDSNELRWYNNEKVDRLGYYPVVVRKNTAYVIPNPKTLEELLGCGSLS